MIRAFDELKLTGRLPSPTGVGMHILRLTQRDDFETEELAQAISGDPALSGRVLKLANAARSTTVQPITTIEEAMMRVGTGAIVSVALGISLVSAHREGGCDRFDYDRFWSSSLGTALAAQGIARGVKGVVPSEAYLCGLLAGIGRLALASVHPRAYGEILGAGASLTPVELARREKEVFAIDHRDVTQAILIDWGLPASLADAAAGSGEHRQLARDPSRLHRALGLAAAVVNALCASGSELANALDELDRERDGLGVDTTTLARLCDELVRDWTLWGEILGIKVPEVPTLDDLYQRAASRCAAREATETAVGLEPAAPVATRSGFRVLVAIADDGERARVASQLTGSDHDVFVASHGDAALDTALAVLPEVVLADAELPGVRGLELARSLRQFEFGRSMYVILMAGVEDDTEPAVDAWIPTPADAATVVGRVNGARRAVEALRRVRLEAKQVESQLAELAIVRRQFEEASLTDPLTELPNRRHAMDHLGAAWAQAVRADVPLTCVIIDIDNFKAVNDRFGHAIGDAVLKASAAIFVHLVRRDEIVCRIGGEEFLVICAPGATVADATICAERLRAAIEANSVHVPGYDGGVTVSLGVAERDLDMTGPSDLLSAADRAVYRAKETGRNRVCVNRPSLTT